jgi:hypothetical protein|tara:strand:+ start:44609 stop:44875 length:267 start_codon:yes stop_codon:yes gene_type:complete
MKSIDTLVETLKDHLFMERVEVLLSWYHTGHESNVDGVRTWDTHCMSDAEMLVLELGLTEGRVHDAEEVLSLIDSAAKRYVEEVCKLD